MAKVGRRDNAEKTLGINSGESAFTPRRRDNAEKTLGINSGESAFTRFDYKAIFGDLNKSLRIFDFIAGNFEAALFDEPATFRF